MLNRGLDKLELLRIVEAVANEKSIDKELVIDSMESAIQKAALTKFGNDNNIEVIIDRESGDIKIQKVLDIVEKVEDPAREISLNDAKKIKKNDDNIKVKPLIKGLRHPLENYKCNGSSRCQDVCHCMHYPNIVVDENDIYNERVYQAPSEPNGNLKMEEMMSKMMGKIDNLNGTQSQTGTEAIEVDIEREIAISMVDQNAVKSEVTLGKVKTKKDKLRQLRKRR